MLDKILPHLTLEMRQLQRVNHLLRSVPLESAVGPIRRYMRVEIGLRELELREKAILKDIYSFSL